MRVLLPSWRSLGAVLLFTFMGLCLQGCDSRHDEAAVAPPAADPLEKKQALSFAVAPYELPSSLEVHFQPLIAYLEKVLQRPVNLFIASSYGELIKMVAHDRVDVAYMGPAPYIVARYKFGRTADAPVHLLATEAPYAGAIVVHQQSDIERVDALRNRTVAFTDYYSLTGHFAGRDLLERHGIALADLTFYDYLGRHERAILSVVHHDFDAAMTSLGLARRFIQRGQPLRILATTEPLPPVALVARPHLPVSLRKKIAEAVIMPDPDHAELLHRFGVFYFPEPAPYAQAYRMIRRFEGGRNQ